MRNRRTKSADTTIGDGGGSESIATKAPSSGALPSVLRGPFIKPSLTDPSPPGLVASPFGPAYLSKRSRPIAADSISVIVDTKYHGLKGYLEFGAPSSSYYPNNYDLASNVWSRWYTYYRRTLESLNKHKAQPINLVDPLTPMYYYEVYHDVVANLVSLLVASKCRQLSAGMVSMTSFMTDGVISDAIALYQRVMAVRAPDFIRSKAITDGLPFQDVVDRCIHFNVFIMDQRTTIRSYAAAWPTFSGSKGYELLGGSSAGITLLMTALKYGVQVLEGWVSGANPLIDVTAMLDLIHMGSYFDQTKAQFPGGLPPIENLQVRTDPGAFNETYCRLFTAYTVTGTNLIAFPVKDDPNIQKLVPVSGFGAPTIPDFTLFGTPKFAVMDDTAGAVYSAAKWALFGTEFRMLYSATIGGGNKYAGFIGGVDLFTAEDQWIQATEAGIDWNDGTAIRTFINGGSPMIKDHIYWPAVFAAQLAGGLEYRFLDKLTMDYSIYMPADDLALNYGVATANMLGVPTACL
jgi:hypothetical protein